MPPSLRLSTKVKSQADGKTMAVVIKVKLKPVKDSMRFLER